MSKAGPGRTCDDRFGDRGARLAVSSETVWGGVCFDHTADSFALHDPHYDGAGFGASAGSGQVTRFVLRPTVSWTGTALTTLMALRHAGGLWWLKAQMTTQIDKTLSLEVLREAISSDGVVSTSNRPAAEGLSRPWRSSR